MAPRWNGRLALQVLNYYPTRYYNPRDLYYPEEVEAVKAASEEGNKIMDEQDPTTLS